MSISSENGVTQIDTEQADYIETIKISDMDCMLVEKDGIFTLAWDNDDGYFVLLTNISKEETIRIASSIKKIK